MDIEEEEFAPRLKRDNIKFSPVQKKEKRSISMTKFDAKDLTQLLDGDLEDMELSETLSTKCTHDSKSSFDHLKFGKQFDEFKSSMPYLKLMLIGAKNTGKTLIMNKLTQRNNQNEISSPSLR